MDSGGGTYCLILVASEPIASPPPKVEVL